MPDAPAPHPAPRAVSPRRAAALVLTLAALLAQPLLAQPLLAQPAGVPEHECDRLAQPPRAAMGRMPALAEGVGYDTVRPAAARPACARAMTEFPAEMRFVAYAARAADRGGDPREAARMWRLAADQGSVEARNNLRKLGVRN